MKRLLSTEFTVGTFALLGLLIIIYMSLKVNDRSAISGTANTYTARFDSVAGLVQKVPVEVAGIAVGHVEKISLKDNKASIIVKVAKNVSVYDNASLTIRDRGILGDRYVLLYPGSVDHPLLVDGGEIMKTFSQSDFEQIAQSLTETANTVKELVQSDNPKGALGKVVVNLRDMTDKMNGIVGDNEGRIRNILANLETFSKDLNDITGENKEQIHSVLVALNDVADSMRDALGKNGDIHQATEKFNNTMASLDRIVQKVERGEGTVGKLLNDESTVNKLNETMDGLNDTLGLFRKVQLNIRYRGEFLNSSKKLQNMIGLTLSPAPDKFIMFEIVSSPIGKTRVVDTTVSSGGNVLSSTETVQTDNNILFTLLLGKRFWDVTMRFGLIRSEGGVGIDYSLFHDRFIASFEAFDFARVNNRAHMRAYGTFVLFKHLLLTGGVDDMITKSGGRNAFGGAGIQFTDEDLKALVTLLPRSGI